MAEEKRGRGRPKEDELVVKPFVPHVRPQIKEKNKEAYAKKAIRRADQLYKQYAQPRPNPLNLEDKDLTKEAKEMWAYIYSTRENLSIALNAKTFENCDEILTAFEGFCAYIRNNNFIKQFKRPDGGEGVMPIVPNVTNLALWLGISRRSMREHLANMSPSQEAEYKSMLGDLLSDGALVGAYNTSSAIFTLKNLCDWADKREDRITKVEDTSSIDEAKKNLEELGYVRPRLLEGGKNE